MGSLFWLLLLSGCANIAEVDRPESGYPAIKFVKTVEVLGVLFGHFIIPGGSVLVGDHDLFGNTEYCGTVAVYLSSSSYQCFSLENSFLIARGSNFGNAVAKVRLDKTAVVRE
jgi:hypothetical protein